MKWIKMPHPIWGKGGAEESVHEIVRTFSFPKWIYRKGDCSIIPPCSLTFEMWELYDDKDIQRFPTLKEAKVEGDKLLRLGL